MQTLRKTKKPGPRGKTKFKNIGRDCQALGVSRIHLWFVLTGQRESEGLMARYEALKRGGK